MGPTAAARAEHPEAIGRAADELLQAACAGTSEVSAEYFDLKPILDEYRRPREAVR